MPTQQVSSAKTVRNTADFPPSVWGSRHFLTCAFQAMDDASQEQYEALKQEVRRMITTAADKQGQKLQLIDTVQRLGIAYHFEKEITDALEKLNHGLDEEDNHNLYIVSLHFRLLRQQGVKISCNVFNKFKDDDGKFKACLMGDVQGLLSLYEAAHQAIQGEDILDEALTFTTAHLQSTISHVSPNLADQINHALRRPLLKTLPRIESRYFISIYPKVDFHNETVLKFAKLDFNKLQALYQEELRGFTQWWKVVDFTTKVPYARDRLVEAYFWILGVYFEPQYTYGRRIMSKLIYILTVIDDTFDAYGTLDELKAFTEAVKRWDIGAIEILPEYMKPIYKLLLDYFSNIEEDMAKEGWAPHGMPYAIKAMQDVVQAYLDEAIWLNEGYFPKIEEYLPVALGSGANILLVIFSFIGMGDVATKQDFDWVFTDPKMVRAASIACRLLDDLASHKFEQKRGHIPSAIECYVRQHGVSEEEAIKGFRKVIANAWKDINEGFLKPTDLPFPLLERILNLTRVCNFLYGEGYDRFTDSHLMKDQIASVLRDPVAL